MNPIKRIAIIAALIIAVAAVIIAKNQQFGGTDPKTGDLPSVSQNELPSGESLPRLVDLGAGTCLPCKMMVPILEELTKEYAGEFQVEYIDVRENEAAATKYNLNVIPTQIFFDPAGKELFRHEGFIPKESILKKWKEFGYEFTAGPISEDNGNGEEG